MEITSLKTIKYLAQKINSLFITKDKFKVLTQAEYDELQIKDADTYYFIKE